MILARKSSYGLNGISILVATFGQFILVINVLCFRSADFFGISQPNALNVIGVLISFANIFALWFTYLFVFFLQIVLFDLKLQPITDFIKTFYLAGMNLIISIVLISFYFKIGGDNGYDSAKLKDYGKFLGSVASILVFAQYIPQILTVWHNQDSASLSLITLCIQAPGSLISVLFLWISGNHWTTWISILIAAMQQFILLGTCIYVDSKKPKTVTQTEFDDDDNQTLVLFPQSDSFHITVSDSPYETPSLNLEVYPTDEYE